MWHDKSKLWVHHTDKYAQHSLIIWPVWQNDWVFVYELSSFEGTSPVAVTFTLYINGKSVS